MNRSRSLSTKRHKPDSVSSQDSSSSEGGNSTSDNQKKRAKTTISIRDHSRKAAAADKRNMSSATSDRQDTYSMSHPLSAQTKLQASVYEILPSTTAIVDYAIGLEKTVS